jgi:undecaprenyl-diphosphatase
VPTVGSPDAKGDMDWIQALILGVVEGVTEYLPVSSTGHLILTQRLMGIGEGEAADAFAICIQVGAIAAVLGLYRGRIAQLLRGLLGREPEGRRLLANLLCAFAPAVVLGLLLEKRIKAHLFNLPAITVAWLVGGVAILAVTRRRRPGGSAQGPMKALEELTPTGALIIGLLQCLAMWPGTSRSLVTILGGLVAGLGVGAAVEFSFLLGVVTLSAATAHDVVKHGHALVTAYSWSSLVAGCAAATVSAAVAVTWMVGYLRRHDLALFGWYRILLALGVGAALAAGRLGG